MVEDNSFGRPPGELQKIKILERKEFCIDCFELYDKIESRGSSASVHVVRSAIRSLFRDLRPALRRTMEKKHFDSLTWLINSEEYEDLEKAFDVLNDWLDKKRITRLDTKDYNRQDAEAENEALGV